MSRSMALRLAALLALLALALTACGGEEAPEVVGGFEIPTVEEGMFNVAAVLIGPHDDGGWSQAHFEGLEYVEENVPNVTRPISRTFPREPTRSRSSAASHVRALI